MPYLRLCRRLGLIVSLALLATTTASTAASAAPQIKTVEVSSTTTGWTQTKLSLDKGQKYTVKASGSWTVDYRSIPRVGPEGYSAKVDQEIYQGCKVSPVPYATLLARVGDGPAFSVGRGGGFTASTDGALSLRINDSDACLGDNAGSVKASVKLGAPRIITTPTHSYAGYAVFGLNAANPSTPGQQPFVSGTWKVPTVTCAPFSLTESAMWVGLGGINAPLEQVATTSSCDVFGKPNYRAHYQMVGTPGGNRAQEIRDPQGKPYSVEANDTMIGSVLYIGNGRYDLNLRNDTKGWHFTKTESGRTDKAAWDTALWILEAVDHAGSVGILANFGQAKFARCMSRFGPIGDPRHTTILKLEISEPWPINYVHKAFPSNFTDSPGASSSASSEFTVTWHAF